MKSSSILVLLALVVAVPSLVQGDDLPAGQSIYADWAPTGLVRLSSGAFEYQYFRRAGLNGFRDGAYSQYEWRKDGPIPGGLGDQEHLAATDAVLADWFPTGAVRAVNGSIEYQYSRRLGYAGQIDQRITQYQWRKPEAERAVASVDEAGHYDAARLSVLADWFPTGQVRARSGGYEFQYARTVGLDGHRDSHLTQSEWRETH